MSQVENNQTFAYTFHRGYDKPTVRLSLPVNVNKLQKVQEMAARVLNFHDLPLFAEQDFSDSLQKFVNEELQDLQHTQAQAAVSQIVKESEKIGKVKTAIAKKYKQTWSKYHQLMSSKLNEFSISYYYLIHSPAVQTLVKLEKKYINIMAKFILDKKQSIEKMQQRQQMEMTRACEHVGFAYTPNDVTILASRHLADIERLQNHWKTQTEKIVTSQKKEFCELVIGLHKELVANNNIIDTNGPIYNCVQQVLESSELKPSYIPDDSLFTLSSLSVKSNSTVATVSTSNTNSGGTIMEESFTVNLGAQLKTMHNIRLLVTDILNFCQYSGEDEMEAQRFQTSISLYSNSLSAVVLISDIGIGNSTGIEQEFASICNTSSEFHFLSLEEQNFEIRQLVSDKMGNKNTEQQDESGESLRLEEGDIYMTKHSNLSQVHIVFHLMAVESHLQSKASLMSVNSRHPVILALRHLLKVACNHDIRTLTIPLLLTRELTEEITFQWCLKRAELVMKCVKGFMMEMATWDGGISRNINFVVPPGVSEEVFDRLRSILPDIFRTTSIRNLTPAHRRSNAR